MIEAAAEEAGRVRICAPVSIITQLMSMFVFCDGEAR